MESIETHPNFPHLQRMHKFGRIEYERMYSLLFGMTYDDIKEVIDSLPMM
jgi:hypothetical protein